MRVGMGGQRARWTVVSVVACFIRDLNLAIVGIADRRCPLDLAGNHPAAICFKKGRTQIKPQGQLGMELDIVKPIVVERFATQHRLGNIHGNWTQNQLSHIALAPPCRKISEDIG